MKIWAKTIKSHKIVSEVVREFALARPSDIDGWMPIISELCHDLDLARPVVLKKHINDLVKFSRVVFRPADFMETIGFDAYEIEIFPETKKKTNERIEVCTY